MATVPVDQLAAEVRKQLEKYQGLTDDALKDAVDETGKHGKALLRQRSPKLTGKYAASWSFSANQTRRDPHAYKRVLHAKDPHYRLTHLLEKGHDLKRNGRVYGHVRAIPHIAPVEAILETELEERIMEGIRKASQ